MNNKKVNPSSLRIPTKSYSQGIIVPCGDTNLLFVTGQLPQDIEGNIVFVGEIEKQVRLVFDRILEILHEAEMNFDDVVKLQIYVKDISYSKTVSAIRDELFSQSKPASTLVEVSGFVKDGCSLEIDVVAAKKNI